MLSVRASSSKLARSIIEDRLNRQARMMLQRLSLLAVPEQAFEGIQSGPN